MNFIDLSNEELILEARNGNKDAYEEFFNRNIKLSYVAINKFKNIRHIDEEDKISLCNLGLIKAFNTFDLSKKIKFSSYAVVIMSNEIKMELRRIKKHKLNLSLDCSVETTHSHKGESEVLLIDTIAAPEEEFSIFDIEDAEKTIKNYFKVAKLTDKQRKVAESYLLDKLTQAQIMKLHNIEQSYVSRCFTKINKDLRNLYLYNELDFNSSTSNKKLDINSRVKKVDLGKILFIFDNYSYLKNKEICSILKIKQQSTISVHKTKYRNGLYNTIKRDTSIDKKVQEFLKSKEFCNSF